MIRYLIPIFIVANIWVIRNSNNPIKARFFILTAAGAILFITRSNTGIVWIPLIFFILFTGGILIIFIILSSVLPNEKTIKIKYSKVFTAITIILIWPLRKNLETNLISRRVKRFISSGINLIFIMRVIIIYFFISININSIERTSIRSIQC